MGILIGVVTKVVIVINVVIVACVVTRELYDCVHYSWYFNISEMSGSNIIYDSPL